MDDLSGIINAINLKQEYKNLYLRNSTIQKAKQTGNDYQGLKNCSFV
jgi:hypothetical protein